MCEMYKQFLILLVCTALWGPSSAIDRVYYIAVENVEWDYAPDGNLLHSRDRNAEIYLNTDPSIPTIGRKYKKAVYYEYTDDSFTTKVERPPWLGILGPFLHAETGENLIVHFFNNASNHNYSIHPHGVFYLKNSEGALYVDGTSGSNKADDHVPPGAQHTYNWYIHPNYGPTRSDPKCITWIFHSHQFAEEEVMTGAVMIGCICKPGTLDERGKRGDVDREYPLLFMIFDENFNVYREENIAEYLGDSNEVGQRIVANFSTFQESNRKHAINGYLYGNLHGLEACQGDRVSFHIAVIGNDEDVHSAYVQGHSMVVYHHRRSTVGVYPGSSVTALTTAMNPGKWIVSSQNVFFTEAGMEALFYVHEDCSNRIIRPSLYGMTRTYFLAAEEAWWQYAPSKYDLVSGKPLSQIEFANRSFGESTAEHCKLNGRYKKAIFQGYTSRTFRNPVPRREDMGILGPPIKAEVGDTVRVVFRNNASRPYSLQSFGFLVDYDENGIQYDNGPNVSVLPGETRLYTWRVPEDVGPTEADFDCLYGRYYSSVDQIRDTYSGLSGSIVICRPGTLDSRGRNLKVHREFYLMFSDFQERYSHYFRDSIAAGCPGADVDALFNNSTFIEENVMRSLNGRIYGNLKGLRMCVNDNVFWYVMSVGSGMDDNHSPHFHGNVFRMDGATRDTVSLTPNIFRTLFMRPINPGIWVLEDQVTLFDRNVVQMEFLYQVIEGCRGRYSENEYLVGKTRRYYIAAEELYWDYAPVNRHIITGERLDVNNVSRLYYDKIPEMLMIGHIYKKALFIEYTDATFTRKKPRTFRDSHLGMQGPFIKAEVGDRIEVVFKNMAKEHNFSIVPHGVFYDKENEGYVYNDSVSPSDKKGGSVAPGETFTYKWRVPAAAGPGPDDFNCIPWAYTSHVNYARDLNTALIGPLIVCKKGILDSEGLRTDVDREFALLFFIVNEGGSAYTDDNIREFLNVTPSVEIKQNLTFFFSNAMLAINGYIFGNVPNATMVVGETAAWYIISLGDTTSTHTVHWHGNTFVRRLAGTHRHDVLDVLPGDFQAVEMLAVNNGTWLMHCHVNNHSENGMDMVYTVLNRGDIYFPG